MRRVLCAGAIALLVGSSAGAQLGPPPSKVQEIQKSVNDMAEKYAQEIADRAKGTTLGLLNPDASFAIRRWDLSVRAWKKEKGAGAAPLLAEGVMFDCLGRMQGVKTNPFGDEEARPFFADLAADRPKRAAKAFDEALKIDPLLVEARLRAARIRAPKDERALRELERLADDSTGAPFAYLAAMSRAEVAQAQPDGAGAIHWYERALVLHPGSTAATIALSSLNPGAPLPFDDLDVQDPYYTYPCTILTSEIDVALSARVQARVVKK